MHLTLYLVAKAKPKNRRRLAVALGLPANASIVQIVQAANAHVRPLRGGGWS